MTLDFSDEDMLKDNYELAEQFNVSLSAIFKEKRRQNLRKINKYELIIITMEDIEEYSIRYLAKREGYSMGTIRKSIEYTYGMNPKQLSEFKKEKVLEKRKIVTQLSDEELKRPCRHLIYIYKTQHKYIMEERKRRGIAIEHKPNTLWKEQIFGSRMESDD